MQLISIKNLIDEQNRKFVQLDFSYNGFSEQQLSELEKTGFIIKRVPSPIYDQLESDVLMFGFANVFISGSELCRYIFDQLVSKGADIHTVLQPTRKGEYDTALNIFISRNNLKNEAKNLFEFLNSRNLKVKGFSTGLIDQAGQIDFMPQSKNPIGRKYSIHLMWICYDYKSKPQPLFPFPKEIILSEYLSKVFWWARKNPNTNVYLWYDSEFVDQRAPGITLSMVSEEHPELASRIILKDIRELDLVQKNSQYFLAKERLWFRVDLARMIAVYEWLKKNSDEMAIYADFDVFPMKETEIFDPIARFHLKTYGAVSGAVFKWNNYENSFFIIDGRYSKTMELFLHEAIEKSFRDENSQTCFKHYCSFFSNLQVSVVGNTKRLDYPMKVVPVPLMQNKSWLSDRNLSEKFDLPPGVNVYDDNQ